MDIYQIKSIGERVSGNPYVGRGIAVGCTADGKCAVGAYFIMGRSENSRNRIFAKRDNEIHTEPFDNSRVQDPSLIIYTAVKSFENHLIITNGDHTDTIYEGLREGKNFSQALKSREFEPDLPNFTPRISSLTTFDNNCFSYEMSILKSIDETGSACARYTFSYPAVAGLGHFIHTYATDGNPIPSFQGEPERISIPDDIDSFTNNLWESLNSENKISLYVRYTRLVNGEITERLINKNNRK